MARAHDDPPKVLVPFLQFRRFPARALDAARRVLDDDASFRAEVADAVDLDDLGEVARLFLVRPDGWEERLNLLIDDEDADAAYRREQREEKRATRRVAQLESTLGEVRAALAERDDDLVGLRSQLLDERAGRRALEEQLDRAIQAADVVEQARLAAEQSRRDLADESERARARARSLEARLDKLQAEVASGAATEATTDPGSEPAAEVETVVETDAEPDEGAATEPPPEVFAEPEPATTAAFLSQAAAAATALAGALERAAGSLADVEPDESSLAADDDQAEDQEPDRPRHGESAERRRPSALPGGVLDDSVQAAQYLFRQPAAVVIVDGYNVSMRGWPELELPAQRRRLVEAMRNLQARTGVEPLVVFDGAEVDAGPSGSLPRSVQVRFSPPGLTADEVVVGAVDTVAFDRPVVVVSSDNEVREGARRRGANVVPSATLVDLLRVA